jgi:hypothetical protein
LATSNYHLFPKLKQALGGHKFKDYHEVETAATQWLMAQHMDLNQQRTEKLAQGMKNASVVAGIMCNCSGIEV